MFANKKIVFVGGCFDLFHIGHLNLLQKAKECGDIVIVGVTADELVEQQKSTKPVIPLKERMQIIESLSCVDFVVAQDKLADVDLLKRLFVDVFISGSDWENKKDEPEGYEWIRNNLEMIFLPRTEGISSTSIKQELNKRKLL